MVYHWHTRPSELRLERARVWPMQSALAAASQPMLPHSFTHGIKTFLRQSQHQVPHRGGFFALFGRALFRLLLFTVYWFLSCQRSVGQAAQAPYRHPLLHLEPFDHIFGAVRMNVSNYDGTQMPVII